ncbi:hypothetical protein AB4Z18_11930 [Leifsonia sp. 2TAF2]|uniref:hypothetical protein n=1 Tax=Leifsonia sp. 2TAF2 TaxID=3233009 RepID=UPI003F9D953F
MTEVKAMRIGRARARALSLWLAIGMLIAAAVLGAVFIILGDQADIAGRAWLTLLLAAAFAGAVVLDATLEEGPNQWYLPASIGLNVVLVVVGLLKIWGGFFQPENIGASLVWSEQLFLFVWIVVLLRASLLITQTYGHRFAGQGKSKATRVFAAMALVFVWVLAVLLTLPPALPQAQWSELWWRFIGAATLMTLVLFLIPVIVFAFRTARAGAARRASPLRSPHRGSPDYDSAAVSAARSARGAD